VTFVPSLALALGSYTGTNRAFEALYLAVWYVGPVNGVPVLDFAAATDGAGVTTLLAFIGIGVALLASGLLRRSRYLR